jgi:outer membrane protein OmpA-like peptidoglycan-associated protein
MLYTRLTRCLTGAAFTAGLMLSLSACTKDEGTAQEPVKKERAGTAIGAATGAAAGAAIGHGPERGRNAIIGAVVGGIAGNRVGNYMDKQEHELKDQLKDTGVNVKREGDKIQLEMPGDITFATGRSAIQPQFESTLANVTETLKKYDDTGIRVRGYTDNTGSTGNNQVLSEQRARSVASFLEDKGVAKVRIDTQGFGESQPIASNSTSEGRAQNRRVTLELYPIVAH